MTQRTHGEVLKALEAEGVRVDGSSFHALRGFNERAMEIIQGLGTREAVFALLADAASRACGR